MDVMVIPCTDKQPVYNNNSLLDAVEYTYVYYT